MEIINVFFNGFIPLILRLAIPITLGAIGATLSERSGIVNLGIEGMMLVGALSAVCGTFFTGEPWIGVLFSIIFGGLFGLIHAMATIRFKAHQIVSGVGINMLAAGLTPVIVKALWGKDGMSAQVEGLKNFTIPIISKIPFLGAIFVNQSIFLYMTVFVAFFSWFVMYKTNVGLRLRAIGDHPKAARTAGISVDKYRYVCVTLSGVLAGLGGAYLSIVQNNIFVQDMIAGRGFMAIAANIFGGWNPLGSFFASLFFSFAQSVRFYVVGINIPDQFIQMIPYAMTLFVLIFAGRKSQAPESLGNIYD